jgi:invasion protein IalB
MSDLERRPRQRDRADSNRRRAKPGSGGSMWASRSVVMAVGGVLLIGVAALVATQGLGGIETVATGVKSGPELPPDASTPLRDAQLQPTAPTPQRPTAQAQQRPAAPATPATPPRRETTQYDSWVVTCNEATVSGAPKRSCIASLRVVTQNRGVMLNWEIGPDPEGRWVTAIHVPSGLAMKDGDKVIGSPPILIPDGVELKFGNGAARRLSFVSCGPQQCMAQAAIDDAFVKEAVANANAKANIVVHTAGGVVPFDLPIKGIDKAITATRK